MKKEMFLKIDLALILLTFVWVMVDKISNIPLLGIFMLAGLMVLKTHCKNGYILSIFGVFTGAYIMYSSYPFHNDFILIIDFILGCVYVIYYLVYGYLSIIKHDFVKR